MDKEGLKESIVLTVAPDLAYLWAFWTHLSYRRALFVKDETVHTVGKVYQCDFGLGAGETDGANKQAHDRFLMGKHMLDFCSDC